MSIEEKKRELLRFMNASGFEWICDVCLETNGKEMVASKMIDSDKLWWRPLHVEGAGFTRLFQGSVYQVYLEAIQKKQMTASL